MIAVLNDHPAMCELLIEHGANVDEYTCNAEGNAEGNTLLNMATCQGCYNAACILVKNGADLDIKNHLGSTPLNTAVYKDQVTFAKLYIENACDIDRADNRGLSPLLTCATFGRTEIAKLLVKAGCDVNYTDYEKQTPLICASQNGFYEIVGLLINKGCDLNHREQYGLTGTFMAAVAGHIECIRLLINAGADINITDTKRRSPLLEAIRAHHVEVASLLVTADCDVNECERDSCISPLHAAVRLASQWSDPEDPHRGLVKVLIDAGCDLNVQDKIGWTPLHQSTFGGQVEVTRLLLKKKAKVDLATKTGDVPLHGAFFSNKEPIVNMLLAAGCNVNVPNQRKEIPLYKAIDLRSSIEIIKQLIEAKSDLNVRESTDGRSLLHAAILKKYTQAAQLLISAGCDINMFDRTGTTPLGLACSLGDETVVKTLLDHPDCELDTGNSNIPVIAASRAGHLHILEMLYNAGADLDKMTDLCETAFQQAVDRNHVDVIKMLVTWGSNPSAPGKVKGLRRCCMAYMDDHPHLELNPLYAAVKNDNFKMIRLAILGTPRTDYRAIKDLEDLIFRTDFAREARLSRVTIYQYGEFFRRMQSQPRRLQDECRGIIRDCIGQRPCQKVTKLQLPAKLNDFILLKEELAKFN